MKLKSLFRRSSKPAPLPEKPMITKRRSATLKQQIKELEAPPRPTTTHLDPPAPMPAVGKDGKPVRGGVLHNKIKVYTPLEPGRKKGGVVRVMPYNLRKIREAQEAKDDQD